VRDIFIVEQSQEDMIGAWLIYSWAVYNK